MAVIVRKFVKAPLARFFAALVNEAQPVGGVLDIGWRPAEEVNRMGDVT